MTQYPRSRVRYPPAFERKSSLVCTWNERTILDLVRKEGSITRAELARATDLTVQSVSRLVDALAAREFLRFGERISSRGPGNTGAVVELNPGAAFTLGISIMTDAVSVALMDLGGHVIDQQAEHVRETGAAALLERIGAVADAMVISHLRGYQRLLGVGVAITGYFVDADQVNPPPPLDDFALVDLRRMFSERLELDIIVENDGTAAAAAESFLGVGTRCRSFGYIHFAAGVGGGVVVDGRVLRGTNGNAGEVAGVIPEDRFEDRPTLALLLEMVRDHGVTVESITDLVEEFDPTWPGVKAWVERVAEPLNMIASSLASILDPEAIVLGGRMPRDLAELLVPRIKLFSVPRRGRPRPQPMLVPGEGGLDPAVIGAAALPLKEHLFT